MAMSWNNNQQASNAQGQGQIQQNAPGSAGVSQQGQMGAYWQQQQAAWAQYHQYQQARYQAYQAAHQQQAQALAQAYQQRPYYQAQPTQNPPPIHQPQHPPTQYSAAARGYTNSGVASVSQPTTGKVLQVPKRSYAQAARGTSVPSSVQSTQQGKSNENTKNSQDGWPLPLRKYIEKSFTVCKTKGEKEETTRILRDIVNDAVKKGEIYTKNWEAFPLPLEQVGPSWFKVNTKKFEW